MLQLARTNSRKSVLAAAASVFVSLPVAGAHAGADFDLMVGVRSVIASFITDDGYRCPDVKRMTQVRYDEDGNAVLKVVCGPLGSGTEWAHKPLRVVAYPEGDYSAASWKDEAPLRAGQLSATRSTAAAFITQD